MIELWLLTQHALALPGVVVPGLDAVLDLSRDAVGVHVLDAAVHAGPVVVLSGRRSPNHVSHLRVKGMEWVAAHISLSTGTFYPMVEAARQ